MLLLADLVLPAPLREAAADERFALEVLRFEAAELRLAEEDPATLLREELAALLREELADERLALEAADDLLALAEDQPFWDELAELLPALLREAAADERLALDEERSELADDRLVVPRPFLVTVFFLS